MARNDGLVLGVDVGTGSVRAGLFSLKGKMLGTGECPIEIYRPKPDFVEQSSENIWAAAGRAIRKSLKSAGTAKGRIIGAGGRARGDRLRTHRGGDHRDHHCERQDVKDFAFLAHFMLPPIYVENLCYTRLSLGTDVTVFLRLHHLLRVFSLEDQPNKRDSVYLLASLFSERFRSSERVRRRGDEKLLQMLLSSLAFFPCPEKQTRGQMPR